MSIGLLAYFAMDVARGNEVVATGLQLTLNGAEIFANGRVGGALHIKADTSDYATGKTFDQFIIHTDLSTSNI